MNDERLAAQFDERRPHLRALAHRILGSASEAEDALQEAWLKLSLADPDTHDVLNLGGWLTTVVARVCLDILRCRKSLREETLSVLAETADGSDPEADIVVADAIVPAMVAVLDTLAPAERVAFVLHDMFDVPFEEIAPIVARSPAAARQLASRARRRLQGAALPAARVQQHRDVVDAFLAASRDGAFARLLEVLSSDVVLRADVVAVRVAAERQRDGAPKLAPELRGAAQVAEAFQGRASHASKARIDGLPGAAWVVGGEVRSAFLFTVREGKITRIDLVMDPDRLAEHEVAVELELV
jgi:RNA polymerase sigma factor (sigma-70 family)